jgi:hypothetical protein
MRANVWSGKVPAYLALIAVAGGLSGCKTLTERYIALEVWKYERCFGHLPPGFTPPGAAAAAAPGRVCGQGAPCQPACQPAAGCDSCQGAAMADGGMPMPAGMPTSAPAGVAVPVGPGGSPGPAPAGGGFTAGKPVIISDEVVMP